MLITLEDFNKLTDQEKVFIFTYGSENCTLVKFGDGTMDYLVSAYGEDNYDDDDIALLESLPDGKWRLVYECDGDYFLCGDDNLVFDEECFTDTSGDIGLLIKQG